MGNVSGLFPDSAGYDSVLDWFCLKQIGIQQVHFFETYIYIYLIYSFCFLLTWCAWCWCLMLANVGICFLSLPQGLFSLCKNSGKAMGGKILGTVHHGTVVLGHPTTGMAASGGEGTVELAAESWFFFCWGLSQFPHGFRSAAKWWSGKRMSSQRTVLGFRRGHKDDQCQTYPIWATPVGEPQLGYTCLEGWCSEGSGWLWMPQGLPCCLPKAFDGHQQREEIHTWTSVLYQNPWIHLMQALDDLSLEQVKAFGWRSSSTY